MPYVALNSGSYQSRSLIAAAQRCLNLFPEMTPRPTDEPFQAVHYPTPGLILLATAPQTPIRCTYVASNGLLYINAGQALYYVDTNWDFHSLGTMYPSEVTDAAPRTTPTSMADNGSILILVDGSNDGWWVDLTQPVASQVLTRIDVSISTGWQGSDRIAYQDGFFLCNAPGTNVFYISENDVVASFFTAAYQVQAATIVNAGANYLAGDVLTLNGTNGATITVNTVDATGAILTQDVTSYGVVSVQPTPPVGTTGGSGNGQATFDLIYSPGSGAFDPLDYASKSGASDLLVAAVSIHRVVWLIGASSFEIWQNSGGVNSSLGTVVVTGFPFSIMYGAFSNFGCCAKYSISVVTNQVYWLHQDQWGNGIIMRGEGLAATRVSTHAIEYEISQYPQIADCVSHVYQQGGHIYVLFHFPSAFEHRGATWVFDTTTEQWHERCWLDSSGLEWRHRAATSVEAYGGVVCGDWENANLYQWSLDVYTDTGSPIKRLRSFPHQIDTDGNRRITFSQCVASMQVGAAQPANSITFVDCRFLAPNNTSLELYANTNDLGSTWTEIDGEMVIVNDAATSKVSGGALYTPSGLPSGTDYTISFLVQPNTYAVVPDEGSSIFVVGRANSDDNGYQATVVSTGSQFNLELTVMPSTTTTVAMGTLSSGGYQIELSMQATVITLAVQRTQDNLWLTSSGSWSGSVSTAISITDSTYASPGIVLIGGNWE